MMKEFDLNIEKILEDWEIFHAVREIIANALDEQVLTKTKEIEIKKESDKKYSIRDFGRGLQYVHLTQNENVEKQQNSELVVGKFGVGLKDALATLFRRDVDVLIKTKYGNITLIKKGKHDFDDLETLHAVISDPLDPDFLGTEFILDGCTDHDIENAKKLFIKFADEFVLAETKYGDILEKKSDQSNIYIKGVRVNQEKNFLFSYNITSINKTIEKSLNRERTNLGRSAYTERIKGILLSSEDEHVAKLLTDELGNWSSGVQHDESNWEDVKVHACKILNKEKSTVFVTNEELQNNAQMVDQAKLDGREIMVVPQSTRDKIHGTQDFTGAPIVDLSQYQTEFNQSFEFEYVDSSNLSKSEKEIFDKTEEIFDLVGSKYTKGLVLISENMRVDTASDANGLWDGENITIKRSQLQNLEDYVGVLLHEIAHSTSYSGDLTRDFELELSKFLGLAGSKAIN